MQTKSLRGCGIVFVITTSYNTPAMATAKKKTSATKKNKLGVKNSLVNNINARKKKGISKSKKKHTVSKSAYEKMKDNWED